MMQCEKCANNTSARMLAGAGGLAPVTDALFPPEKTAIGGAKYRASAFETEAWSV